MLLAAQLRDEVGNITAQFEFGLQQSGCCIDNEGQIEFVVPVGFLPLGSYSDDWCRYMLIVYVYYSSSKFQTKHFVLLAETLLVQVVTIVATFRWAELRVETNSFFSRLQDIMTSETGVIPNLTHWPIEHFSWKQFYTNNVVQA